MRMGIDMKVIMNKEKSMVKESMIIVMETIIKVNGSMTVQKDKELP